MKLFKLYLGGYNLEGWSAGLIVTEDSLSKLTSCKSFADKHLVDCKEISKVTFIGHQYEGYDTGCRNYLIEWTDGVNLWKMEVTLSEIEGFL